VELAYLYRPGHRMRVPADATGHVVVLSAQGDAVMDMPRNQAHAERFAHLPWVTRMEGAEPCHDGTDDVWVTVVFNGVSSWEAVGGGGGGGGPAGRETDFVLAWLRADGSLAAVTPVLRVVSKFPSTAAMGEARNAEHEHAVVAAITARILATGVLEGAPVVEVGTAVSSCYGTAASVREQAASGGRARGGCGGGRLRMAMAARMRAAISASAHAAVDAVCDAVGGGGSGGGELVGRKRARAPSRTASDALAAAEADGEHEGGAGGSGAASPAGGERAASRCSARLSGRTIDFAALAAGDGLPPPPSAPFPLSPTPSPGARPPGAKRRAVARTDVDGEVAAVDWHPAADAAVAATAVLPQRAIGTSQSTVEHEGVATAAAAAAQPGALHASEGDEEAVAGGVPLALLPGLTRDESAASAAFDVAGVMQDEQWQSAFMAWLQSGGGDAATFDACGPLPLTPQSLRCNASVVDDGMELRL
jgi:hypothetical protein